MNRTWIAAGAAMALLVAGCSTSQTAQTDGEAVADKSATDAQASEQAGPAALPDFAPAADTPAVESLSWGDDGSLRLGFADGKWAKIDPKAQDASVGEVTGTPAGVVAVSPGAKLALAASNPPVVVRLRDGQTVLRLSTVSDFATGGFLSDGEGLFVVEPHGKLHVWRQGETDLDRVATRDLKKFMARQSPDFTANLSSLSTEALVTETNAMILATASGKVLHWKPSKPGEIATVVKLPTAARSFGFDGRYVAATATDGSLRAISLFENSFLSWSMKERGEMVAASPKLQDKFVVADAGSLALRGFADGATDWKAALPEGELCGLAFSPQADTLAVCVDSGVVLVEPQTGKTRAALRRSGDAIEWR
ncbi:WD40 repeat domain-containing protein [Persicimonas caeni]|uniref:WD40 repeat domain-containing protein n=1 Tax=Persicimonas caeni TaxID=2292766 RepID=A0A4Y6PT15_PERCE|nr:WD40 repeat domain-containing protein [Persicimonas caeni]QDG51466.1 WD40 repeat domain-containing protein [Persicimonas caeni]QED32687.1 WD40 repeat domain-containing protein [Persicimonas caeni]